MLRRSKLWTALLTVVGLCVATSCRQKAPSERSSDATTVIHDDFGGVVSLNEPVQRIASLAPASTEILYAIGCGPKIVLRDRNSDYPEATRSVPTTNPFQLSVEHIGGFRPDIVILTQVGGDRFAALQTVGLNVARFDPQTIPAIAQTTLRLGQICGASESAQRLAQSLEARLSTVMQRVRGRSPPRIYVEVDAADISKPWTAGTGSLIDYLVTVSGGINVFGNVPRQYAPVSVEEVLRADPDFVLIADRAEPGTMLNKLRQRAGWQGLRALRQGHVIDTIADDLLVRPGPRFIQGVEALASILHPH